MTDRCIGRNTSVANYDLVPKKVTQLYTMREMVLLEDELKTCNEELEVQLDDTNK